MTLFSAFNKLSVVSVTEVLRLSPRGGWTHYAMGESLIDFAMTISNRGRGAWHYLSPVSSTFVLESPQSDGCILVEMDDSRVQDVLLYPPKSTDEEFDRVVRELTSRFTLEAQNP